MSRLIVRYRIPLILLNGRWRAQMLMRTWSAVDIRQVRPCCYYIATVWCSKNSWTTPGVRNKFTISVFYYYHYYYLGDVPYRKQLVSYLTVSSNNSKLSAILKRTQFIINIFFQQVHTYFFYSYIFDTIYDICFITSG